VTLLDEWQKNIELVICILPQQSDKLSLTLTCGDHARSDSISLSYIFVLFCTVRVQLD